MTEQNTPTGVEDVERGNRLIAEFMELQYSNGLYKKQLTPWIATVAKYLEYNTDWNCLMPVVEKIGDIYNEADPELAKALNKQAFNIRRLFIMSPRIHIVWKSVVEFIEWHNLNQNK